MAGFTDAYELTVLDASFHSTTDKIKFATDASGTDNANIAALTIPFKAASAGSKKSNGALTSGTATAAKTYTHFAIFASDGTTQKTDWTGLTSSVSVSAGGTLTIADEAIVVTLD